MDHSYFKDRVSAFFDSELKHEEHEVVRQHIEGCSECQALLEQLEKFDRFARSQAEPGEGDYWEAAARRIEDRLEESGEPEVTEIVRSSWKGLGWKIASVAASVAVLTFIALHRDEIEKEVDEDQKEISGGANMASPSFKPEGQDQINRATSHKITPPKKPADSLELDAAKREAGPSVETSEEDRVLIRGGRAGEVGYTADGLTDSLTAPVEEKGVADKSAADNHKTMKYSAENIRPDSLVARQKKSESIVEADELEAVAVQELADAVLKQVSVETVSLAESAPASAEFAPDTTQVSYWRAKLAALETEYEKPEKDMNLTVKRSRSKAAGFDSSATIDSAGTLKSLERVKCYYKIGLLTDDLEEYERALRHLKDYLAKLGVSHADLVRSYIEELKGLEKDRR